jgi:hypothetical protein
MILSNSVESIPSKPQFPECGAMAITARLLSTETIEKEDDSKDHGTNGHQE